MAMEIDKPPFDNPDLRLALKYAIDREQILKVLFSGYGALGNDHPIPPTDPYFNKDLPQRKHDPDRAAFYLKRSGHRSADHIAGLRRRIRGRGRGRRAVSGERRQSRAQDRAQAASPADGFWDNVWLKAPFVESYWNGRPAATHMLSVVYGAGAPLNETHWRNDKFEKLLADAKSETDEAKRKRVHLGDAGACCMTTAERSSRSFATVIDAHRDTSAAMTPHGGSTMDNGYILEKAYLKP